MIVFNRQSRSGFTFRPNWARLLAHPVRAWIGSSAAPPGAPWRIRMKKTLTVLAAVGTLAVVSVAAPTDANAQWRRGGAVAAGVVTGLAAGAIIGGALAPRYYEPAPVYVAPAPAYAAPAPAACVQPQWVWSPRRGEYVWRKVSVPCGFAPPVHVQPSRPGCGAARPISFERATCLAAACEPRPSSRGRRGRRLGHTHVIEHGAGRPAIELEPVRLLIRAEGGPRHHAGLAVDLVGIERARREVTLDRLDLFRPQLRSLAPRVSKRPRAPDPVGEIADKQNVQVREIVVLEHVIVLQREECRTVGAFGQQQRGRRRTVARWRAAVGGSVAALEPLGDRQLRRGLGDRAVDGLWLAHLVGPALAVLPAEVGEMLGDGGKRIRY